LTFKGHYIYFVKVGQNMDPVIKRSLSHLIVLKKN